MLTYLRYALATLCFAASVGCLLLWLQSELNRTTYFFDIEGGEAIFEVRQWTAALDYQDAIRFGEVWRDVGIAENRSQFEAGAAEGLFARFPLWYAALVFALAGVGFLYLGPRFTIRSALVATTVVAALIGMAVIL